MNAARRISLVQFTNFGPFEQAEVDFSQPGLTGIEGVIGWKAGADSNGSGKSYLIDGPAWCLWGRCLREDYTGDDVVRIGSTGGTSVETRVEGGEQHVRVVRYRQHPTFKNRVYLFVDGHDVTRGTDAETQAVIDHLLMDFTTAQSSIFFGAREDVRSFFTAPDAQRKRILDQILGLAQYAEAEKVARRRLAKVAADLTPIRDRCTHLEGSLATQRGLLSSLPDGQDVEQLRFGARLVAARVRALERAIERRTEEVEEAQLELAFEQEEASAAMAEYRAALDQYARTRSEADREVRKTYGVYQSSETLLARAVSAWKAHEAAAGKVCTACGQTLPKGKHAEMFTVLQADVEKAKAQALAAKGTYYDAKAVLDGLEPPTQPYFPHVDLATEFLRLEEDGLVRLEQRLALARTEQARADALLHSATAHLAQLRTQIAKDEAELTERQAHVAELQALADRLTFWVDGFGNQGLRSFLIESEVGEINRRASQYAQRLLGAGAVVRLSATTQLKTSVTQREKLSIEAVVPGCTLTYAGASKGQKRRLDLSLLLAFRDIVAHRSVGAFRQFFADELFDGLDQTGTQYVVELLREVAEQDCPVVLVTHNLHLKSAVDRIVTVRHEHEYCATVVLTEGS